MAYRNKTYVIFDGDNDMWAYGFMKGWKNNDKIDFNFHDAHDLSPISTAQNEAYIKGVLRERLKNTKQAIVLVGDNTKYLYRFVCWEIETCLSMKIPVIVVNLNNLRRQDDEKCPAILKGTQSVHVSFRLAIIKHALDNFPEQFATLGPSESGPYSYSAELYKRLGISS